ncbi:MAG TPA: alpha/beta fold hydrolase [Hyphomicrobiaceae bacterium]|nr:alpha/beta fold hydrolase [Hyphomicrobiaceae bacterium]
MTPDMIEANGLTFETYTWGEDSRPLVLMLHGFPEHALAWRKVAEALSDRYRLIAPNQRGYGRSSKPAGVDNYRAQHLAKDMLALAEKTAPRRRFHLVAHDWGASVAYMMAFMQPRQIATLSIANGVHPLPFQRALLDDPDQRAASQYMTFLRRDDAAALLTEDNCRRLLRFVTEGWGGGTWMSDTQRAEYLRNWQEPGAMEAMVAWYKATPLVVPKVGEVVTDDPMARVNPAMVRVRMPHLLLWGREDKALRPSSIAGLGDYCDDLTTKFIDGADHWIVHQKTDEVIAQLGSFLDAHPIREA